MTKQDILKAIENGENVWYIDNNMVCCIENKFIQRIYKGIVEYYIEDKNHYKEISLFDLYKTKAEAEHYLNHANVTRTEQLPFLTWEEFLEKKAIHFIDNKGIDFVLRITDNKIKLMVFFMVSKTWDLTEENFYKAYDECVRLFKGEL